MNRRLILAAAVTVTAITALAGCSAGGDPLSKGSGSTSGSDSIIIGSLNYPESETLAAIYSQALQGAGVKVQEKFNIGAREITMPALKDGSIDLIPEYSGSVLTYLDPKSTASAPDDVMTELQKKLPSGLKALKQSAAQDSDVLAITQETADKHNLKKISDLKDVAGSFTVGGNPEFQTRQAGMVGLKSVYGLTFGGYKNLDEAGPLTITALANGQVQAADMFSTDPSMDEKHFVALADDKHLFAAQNVFPLIAAGKASDTVQKTLDAVSAQLTTQELIALNEKVTNGESFAKAATEWLSAKGLK
ncbi:ABC transporter substrate-binding protein [Leifsonia shinshuensis]|uniref:ABC transporter substrate-binding protein n=1 Tax=Leifsonia shinshuensis TaxID=150026 RepID=A0A7G6YE19_9MICO|nr:ABC transporter substrate-binding protein [Leifsonia shinshuensis]QNE36734.1 ABC transporter substrate-binding protein [Leifsonia shinshuensis]